MYINKSKAIKNYTNTELSSNLAKNSFQIVESILIELQRSMKIVSDTSNKKILKDSERERRNLNFSRACSAIYALQTSLDYDKGGKMAIQLFQVYEFCRKQLIKAFTKKVVNGINRAINTLNEIINAWSELIKKNATL